jgi:hypothetical protein
MNKIVLTAIGCSLILEHPPHLAYNSLILGILIYVTCLAELVVPTPVALGQLNWEK